MLVAPRIVNDVSYVTDINHENHFSWQAQYLVILEYHFSWQAQYLVTLVTLVLRALQMSSL